MAPRKLRTIVPTLRGLTVPEALAQLRSWRSRKAAELVGAVVRSAAANATHNAGLSAAELTIADVVVDGGFVLRRFVPVSKGMAHPILKRTCHVTVRLTVDATAKVPQPAKGASEIETLTAEQYSAQAFHEGHEHSKKGKVDSKKSLETPEAAEATGPHTDANMEAFQQMKMNQQGGSKQKTHRRKSLGGG